MRVVLLAIVVVLGFGGATGQADGKRGQGKLTLSVQGLPKGTAAQITLKGLDRRTKAISRPLSLSRIRRNLSLPSGKYRIRVLPTAAAANQGPISRGARILPVTKVARVVVRARRNVQLKVRYGSIINPGLKTLNSDDVRAVIGDPTSPTSLILKGPAPEVGSVVSVPPSNQLPQGLLAEVTSSTPVGGSVTVSVSPASIYNVAPNMVLNHRLDLSRSVEKAAVGCSSINGISPYKRITNLTVSGGWNTVSVIGAKVAVGVKLVFDYDVEAGVNFSSGVGGSCELRVPLTYFQGLAGPIPIYGQISGDLKAGISAGAKMKTGGSTHVRTGAATIGTPPGVIWAPIVGFESPKLNLDATTYAEASAGIGLRLEAGVGAALGANLRLQLDNSLEFAARRTACTWNLNLGSFSGGGKLLGWDISSPSTPPVYNKELWRGCASQSNGRVLFDGSPNTSPPPRTLGPYSMSRFGRDRQETNIFVDGVNGPTGRIKFPNVLGHLTTANDRTPGYHWNSGWSHGYAGDVYATDVNKNAIIELPAGTKAFYFYAEPSASGTGTITARANGGTSSGPQSMPGRDSARYFGFYATGKERLSRITVSSSASVFAIGEFGIAE